MMNKILVFLLVITVTGCAKLPGGKADRIVKEDREEIKVVERAYRPEGKKPGLPVLDENSDIDDFIRYALLNNPRVESAFYRWQKTVEQTAAAKYLPAPEITLEASITSMVQSLIAGIMFMFPAKEKILLEVESLSTEVRRERLNFEAEILRTAFRVKDICYRRWLLREKIKLTEKTLRILEELETFTLAKLETGQSSQSDVLGIQIEKSQVQNVLADIKDYEEVLLRQFAEALGVPAGEKAPSLPENLPFTGEKSFDEEEIWSAVKNSNPRIALAKEEIKQGEIFIRQAYREYSPDFKAGIMQSFFSSMAMTSPFITVTVPRKGRVAALVAATESGLKMREAEYTATELETAVMLSEALFRWRQADRETKLYKNNLLPKAEANTSLVRFAYIAGSAELSGFFGAERTFYDFSINYLSAVAFREIALNEISLVIAGIYPEGYPWEN